MIHVDKSLKSFSGEENRPFQSVFIVQDYTDVFMLFKFNNCLEAGCFK